LEGIVEQCLREVSHVVSTGSDQYPEGQTQMDRVPNRVATETRFTIAIRTVQGRVVAHFVFQIAVRGEWADDPESGTIPSRLLTDNWAEAGRVGLKRVT